MPQQKYINPMTQDDFGIDLTPVSGMRSGLTLVLDAKSNLNAPRTVNTDFKGFTVAITNQMDAQLVSERGFVVPTGHFTQVAMTASGVETDPSLKTDLSPERRSCYFQNEFNLTAFIQ